MPHTTDAETRRQLALYDVLAAEALRRAGGQPQRFRASFLDLLAQCGLRLWFVG